LGSLTFCGYTPASNEGAWTGTLGAWILGLSHKKAFFAIAGGVILAGIIVSILVALWGVGAQTIFYDQSTELHDLIGGW